MTDTLPWQPLQSHDRSGQPETTVYGIVAVSLGSSTWCWGEETALIWSRSLLKPWQWLSYTPELLAMNLPDEALTMIAASHQGEPIHQQALAILQERLAQHHLTLECPAMPPLSDMTQAAHTWNHPCAGKHAGFLLTAHHDGLPTSSMLAASHPLYQRVTDVLSEWLPQWNGQTTLTTDGCGMPNWGFRPTELVTLYRLLASQGPSTLNTSQKDAITRLTSLMLRYPLIMGGHGRLDSELMSAPAKLGETSVTCWAKEGADGLLGVGIEPSANYPDGIGILIKLAAGYYPEQFKPILSTVMRVLGLSHSSLPALPNETSLHRDRFHFYTSLRAYTGVGASSR